MDVQIHFIETEAYGAVLRAFIAQSEVLSWGKEELITELRKELRVSDAEHREILGKINLDESIQSIREWRKDTPCQQLNAMNPPVLDPTHVGSVPRKRLKPAQIPASSSPKYPPRAQPFPVISPPSLTPRARDGQWNSNTVVLSPSMPFPQNMQAASSDKAGRPKKVFIRSGFENIRVEPDVIEIRATDKLLNEVEKICGGVNPDPGQVERAKLVLREHERALMHAIGKLTSLSDDDDRPARMQKQHRVSNEEGDRSRMNYSKRKGFLCLDFQNGP